jgi:hypothetical protein
MGEQNDFHGVDSASLSLSLSLSLSHDRRCFVVLCRSGADVMLERSKIKI